MTPPEISNPATLAFLGLHAQLSQATLAVYLIVLFRLLYLHSGGHHLHAIDQALIVVSQVLLAFVLLSGGYLSTALGVVTRAAHHVLGLAPLLTTLFYLTLAVGRVHYAHRRRVRWMGLSLFGVNLILAFLAYWMSSGASFGWWPWPELFPPEYTRPGL